MPTRAERGGGPVETITFTLGIVVAIFVAVACWWAYQLTLMVYTPCGGTSSCNDSAQTAIYIGFIVALLVVTAAPIVVGFARSARKKSFWWLPALSAAGAIIVLALSWPLNSWAAS